MITNQKYIQENIGSTLVRLTPEEVKAVRQMADKANAANGVGYTSRRMILYLQMPFSS